MFFSFILNIFPLQLKEIRRANVAAIKNALQHPTADMEASIWEIEQRYQDNPAEVDAEPDLCNYATIDMAALKDVRTTGAEYILSLEALMQSKLGPEPGYLPERDAQILLVGVSLSLFHISSSLLIIIRPCAMQ